jgi:Polyketide cyclase / dehydrase and lipid transport
MKILKITAIVLLSIIVLLVLIAFLLPKQVSVSRNASINASKLVIYPLVAAPTNWQQWSVWNQRDPNMQMTYSGNGAGAGAKWSWQSKTEGNGDMEIISTEGVNAITYQLKFADWGMVSTGKFFFEPTNDVVTNVVWSMNADLGNNPLMRYMGLFMDRMVGKDFEASLAQLKIIAEKSALKNPLNGLIAPPAAPETPIDATTTATPVTPQK